MTEKVAKRHSTPLLQQMLLHLFRMLVSFSRSVNIFLFRSCNMALSSSFRRVSYGIIWLLCIVERWVFFIVPLTSKNAVHDSSAAVFAPLQQHICHALQVYCITRTSYLLITRPSIVDKAALRSAVLLPFSSVLPVGWTSSCCIRSFLVVLPSSFIII